MTVDDVRQPMGACTPHFALQLRERIRALISGLLRSIPRGSRASARSRLDQSAVDGEIRRHAAEPGLEPLPNLAADAAG